MLLSGKDALSGTFLAPKHGHVELMHARQVHRGHVRKLDVLLQEFGRIRARLLEFSDRGVDLDVHVDEYVHMDVFLYALASR